MNPYSNLYDFVLDENEKREYLDNLYNRLLEHRYRYYVLDAPVIEDFEYDYLEKYYNTKAEILGVKSMQMVDFDPNDVLAIEAKSRVDSATDYYSLWEKEMLPIWERIGKPSKEAKREIKDE